MTNEHQYLQSVLIGWDRYARKYGDVFVNFIRVSDEDWTIIVDTDGGKLAEWTYGDPSMDANQVIASGLTVSSIEMDFERGIKALDGQRVFSFE